jgi:NDP-sugar pyrophosphorylase family protein
MLERNVEWLREHGITDLVVNLHHAAEAVIEHFGDGARFGVRIDYSRESELRGTAGALLWAADALGSSAFLVVYADNLVTCDPRHLSQIHRRSAAAMTIVLHERADPRASGLARMDPAGMLMSLEEKPDDVGPPPYLVNAGLIVCEPTVLAKIPADRPSDIARDLIPSMLASGWRILGHLLSPAEHVYWIDTPEDLRRTEAALEARPA